MKIRKELFRVEKDGFFGAYFQNPVETDRCIIALLGDDIDDRMAVSGAKWLQGRNCNVMTMAPARKDYGYHSYPLERFEKAIAVIRQKGNRKIGIVGASTTGMLALAAASHYPEITLTIAMTPCDFIIMCTEQSCKVFANNQAKTLHLPLAWCSTPMEIRIVTMSEFHKNG